MPTKLPRIAVPKDAALSAALERVAPHFGDAPLARIVHDLAIRGAVSLSDGEHERAEAVERLIAFSAEPLALVDADVLEDIDARAWGEASS